MICGVHAVYEALAAGRQPVERIHVLRDAKLPRLKEILDLARERGVPVRREDRTVLDKLSGGVVHQGIIAIAGEASYAPIERVFESKLPCVVVLDANACEHLRRAVVHSDGQSEMVLTHRRSQQRVTRSVEHESINGAIELRQCLAQGARRVA